NSLLGGLAVLALDRHRHPSSRESWPRVSPTCRRIARFVVMEPDWRTCCEQCDGPTVRRTVGQRSAAMGEEEISLQPAAGPIDGRSICVGSEATADVRRQAGCAGDRLTA